MPRAVLIIYERQLICLRFYILIGLFSILREPILKNIRLTLILFFQSHFSWNDGNIPSLSHRYNV